MTLMSTLLTNSEAVSVRKFLRGQGKSVLGSPLGRGRVGGCWLQGQVTSSHIGPVLGLMLC